MQSPAEILGIETIRFIEPFFANLPDNWFTSILEEVTGDQARLLVDEDSDPICMAVHTGDDAWIAGCFHLRKPTGALITRFENLGGDIYQEDRGTWEAAVRGYYSREMVSGSTPAFEDLNPSRIGLVRSLVASVLGRGEGRSCLDCGCGSGVGSLVLRNLGYSPLSCDNDPSLLTLGIMKDRLLPEETMLIDASFLRHYTGHCDVGLGLMFGEIHEFNAEMWEKVTTELILLADHCLITTGTEQEAIRISRWARKCEVHAEIFENTADPIYDRWVCNIAL